MNMETDCLKSLAKAYLQALSDYRRKPSDHHQGVLAVLKEQIELALGYQVDDAEQWAIHARTNYVQR